MFLLILMYFFRCCVGFSPPTMPAYTVRCSPSSLFKASINLQNVGWVAWMVLWKPVCQPSTLLFVRGKPSAIRLFAFQVFSG